MAGVLNLRPRGSMWPVEPWHPAWGAPQELGNFGSKEVVAVNTVTSCYQIPKPQACRGSEPSQAPFLHRAKLGSVPVPWLGWVRPPPCRIRLGSALRPTGPGWGYIKSHSSCGAGPCSLPHGARLGLDLPPPPSTWPSAHPWHEIGTTSSAQPADGRGTACLAV